MECPECKSTNATKGAWDDWTPQEKSMELAWQAMHRGPQAPLTLAAHFGTWGAKIMFSSVYTCGRCYHKWRKWSL